MFRSFIYSLFISLFCCSLLIHTASAQFSPEDPEVMALAEQCESDEGTWGSCAPCLICMDQNGTIRSDTSVMCGGVCSPWCECPQGKSWDGVRCAVFDHPPCGDERPEVATCRDAGGTWNTCDSACASDLCVTSEGSLYDQLSDDQNRACPQVCLETCQCPSGQDWDGEQCKAYADLYPLCDENMNPNGDVESILSPEESCHQSTHTSTLPLSLLLLMLSGVSLRLHSNERL